ncbi:TetR/AcrR family transcriptional regulator [Streptomyces sp. NPDC001520]|uniref:TetR/AcrR family transcriptional regulator n=1 Tax=Streptomyces sp. NPDC001520 TaxID=3364581 RepID=UPI0036A8CB70
MPIDVDEAVRVSEIARATIRVAGQRGSRGVTLRSVADELGRSTAFITNFVPSRAQLIVNALEYAQAGWKVDRQGWLSGAVGADRLAGLARWMCSTSEDDGILRSLWVEAIADIRASTMAYDVIRSVTDDTYVEFLGASRESGLAEAEQIADTLYLFCRGFHIKSVEDPEGWTDARANSALEYLLKMLVFQDATRAEQPPVHE